MDRHLLTWDSRRETDEGNLVRYTGVTLSRDLGELRAGRRFALGVFDRLTGTLDLYETHDSTETPAPTKTVKLRLVDVPDHDDLVTHAPVWRRLFEEKINETRVQLSQWVLATGQGSKQVRECDDSLTLWEHELAAFERRVARARAES